MDTLELPQLAEDDSLETALERLRQTDTRAVVVEHAPEDLRLYFNDVVLDAWCEGKTTCGELTAYAGVPVMQTMQMMELAIAGDYEPEAEPAGEVDYEAELDAAGMSYAIRRDFSQAGMAFVITRHEGLAHDLRSRSRVCVCTGPARHRVQSPPKADGQPCTFCLNATYQCW